MTMVLTVFLSGIVSGQQKPTTGYAPVGGLKMYYEIHGSGDPVVLLHGAFMAISGDWNDWIGELSKTEPVVTFCVYGFHIGCETAVTLRKAGFDARYMSGGHFAWKAINGPVKLFE